MSALSNQLLPETFYEAASECLWPQAVSVLAILVAYLFYYAPGAYMARLLKIHTAGVSYVLMPYSRGHQQLVHNVVFLYDAANSVSNNLKIIMLRKTSTSERRC